MRGNNKKTKDMICFTIVIVSFYVVSFCSTLRVYKVVNDSHSKKESIALPGFSERNLYPSRGEPRRVTLRYVELNALCYIENKDRFEFSHHSHVYCSSLGIPETPSNETMNERIHKTQISLVISYCQEDFSWIFNYIDMDVYNVERAIIYSKCGNYPSYQLLEKLALKIPIKYVKAPNVGRCDHAYASWIIDNYKYVQDKKGDENNIVFFVKDNAYHKDQFHSFQEVFTMASEAGFGCAEKPVCDCDIEQCTVKKDVALMLHKQTELDQFKMNSHNRIKRDKESKDQFKNEKYPNLKAWKDDMGIVVPHSEAIPVCYGGIFAAQQKQILNQPEAVWQNIVNSLARGNNIVEGHYAERLWAAALSGIDDDYGRKVSEAVLPHVHDTFQCWNRKGMMMVPQNKEFNSSLFEHLKN